MGAVVLLVFCRLLIKSVMVRIGSVWYSVSWFCGRSMIVGTVVVVFVCECGCNGVVMGVRWEVDVVAVWYGSVCFVY